MSLRIAVLGGGIMGVSLAVRLARRGVAVTLFERETALLQGASRFNEGKIHLGCLYSASGGLETAHRVLTGGLRFFDLVEDLLERPIAQWIAPGADHYLVHRDSVVGADQVAAYMGAIADLVDTHPDRARYPGGPRREDFRRVALEEVPLAVAHPITACLRVPERSVATQPLADALTLRAHEQPGLEILTGTTVLHADLSQPRAAVHTDQGRHDGFDYVVNALWQGRPQVDKASIGHCDPEPHHRYRVSLFLEDGPDLGLPNAVVAAGPFGDVKNYGGGRSYLSWYPAGLIAELTGTAVPDAAPLEGREAELTGKAILDGLVTCLPGLQGLDLSAWTTQLAGGWVYAQGRGSLDDPGASLHRRDLMGVFTQGRYISVDTGKFSTAPYLAAEIEAMIL
jgi:glycine/D-amino acid oxidase-like deaminating enzyme